MDGSRSGSAGQRETRGSNRVTVDPWKRGARSFDVDDRSEPETSFCPPRCRRDVRVYFVRLSIRAAAQGGPRNLLRVLYTPGDQLTGAEGKKGTAFEGGRHHNSILLEGEEGGWKSRGAAKSEFEDCLLDVSRSLLLGEEREGERRTGRFESLIRRGSPACSPVWSARLLFARSDPTSEPHWRTFDRRPVSLSLFCRVVVKGCQSRDDRGQRDETRSFRGIPFLAVVRREPVPALSQPRTAAARPR